MQALRKQLSAVEEKRALLQSSTLEAHDLVFRLIEKQSKCATRQEGGEEVDKGYQLLQIFAKTSQLLEEGNGRMKSDLVDFEIRSQHRRQTVKELFQQARVFMDTPSYAYPGSAAGMYNLQSLSDFVGAQFWCWGMDMITYTTLKDSYSYNSLLA